VFIATFYERGHLWFHVIYVRPLLIPSTSFGVKRKAFFTNNKSHTVYAKNMSRAWAISSTSNEKSRKLWFILFKEKRQFNSVEI